MGPNDGMGPGGPMPPGFFPVSFFLHNICVVWSFYCSINIQYFAIFVIYLERVYICLFVCVLSFVGGVNHHTQLFVY